MGVQVDVVLGLHNSAGEAFNITHIAGSINSPQAFQYYVQNFTLKVGVLNAFSPLQQLAFLASKGSSWKYETSIIARLTSSLFFAALQLLPEAWRASFVAIHFQTRQLLAGTRVAAVSYSLPPVRINHKDLCINFVHSMLHMIL